MSDSAPEPHPQGMEPAQDVPAPSATGQGGMLSGGDAFVVAWNPVPTASRVATASRSLRMSLVSSLLFPVVILVVWLATGRSNQILVTLALVSLAISAVFAIARIVRLAAARRALARVPRGDAMRIDREGITVTSLEESPGAAPTFLPWLQVTGVRAAGKSTGVGPDLVVSYPGGQWRAPLSFLDALPGTIDSALRAYSGARVGLDLSGLDALW